MTKRIIKFLYLHYSGGGTRSIPYESAILTVAFFIMMHILQLKMLFSGKGLVSGDNELERFGGAILILIPVYLLLNIVYKKKIIVNMDYDESLKKKHSSFVILYAIATCVLYALIVLIKKGLL